MMQQRKSRPYHQHQICSRILIRNKKHRCMAGCDHSPGRQYAIRLQGKLPYVWLKAGRYPPELICRRGSLFHVSVLIFSEKLSIKSVCAIIIPYNEYSLPLYYYICKQIEDTI